MTYDDYMKEMMVFVRMDDRDYLGPEEQQTCLKQAVDEHTRNKPLVRFYDIGGDGGYDYDLPGDWLDQFSKILSVEYPAGNRSREFITPGDYEVIFNGAKWQLRFLADTPAVGNTIRLEYTTVHTLSNEFDTIAVQDQGAFILLAASYCCSSLAAKYAGSQDSTMTAEIVDLAVRRSEYSALEKALCAKYYQKVGKKEKDAGPEPALETGDIDPKFARRIDYLTHPRRWR